MTADSSTVNNPPQLQTTAWAQVVAMTSSTPPPSSSSPSPPLPVSETDQVITSFSDSSSSTETRHQLDNSDGDNSNVGPTKKPAWNKPLNGVVSGVGPVMGGSVSWPALSESTRPPSKSVPEPPKPNSDSSVSNSQGHVMSISPKNQKQVHTNNPNPNYTPNGPNHKFPVRQRSGKRGVGGSMQSSFNLPPPPPPMPPPFPQFEVPYGGVVAALPDSSFREPNYKGGSWEVRPIGGFGSHSVNDQSSQRGSYRRGRPQGSRRDKDRDFNASRSSNGRGDVHVPQRMVPPPRGFLRAFPPGAIPFMMPQSVRHFGNPMVFDTTSPYFYLPTLPPEPFRGVPFVTHALPPPPPPPPAPMFFPVVDPTLPALPTLLVNQIEYYFSDANLVKDNFLRSKMDDEGWVHINLIAGFPRVQQMTCNVQLILDSLRASSTLEIKDNKVRRRNEWRKWIPTSGHVTSDSDSHSPIGGSTYNTITTSLQKVTMNEATTNKISTMGRADSSTEVVTSENSSELAGHSKVASGECINEEAISSQI